MSGWMIFKSISNSPRTSKASRITKQTTRICGRRRTDMSPLSARTDRQEEPMQPSAKRAPTPHVPDLAGCVSWSFLLLPPRTPTPAAPGQWVIPTKSRAHETTCLPTKPSHFPLLGGGGGWVGSGSLSQGRAHASAGTVTSVHRGLSPLRKHLHLLQSGSFLTGQAQLRGSSHSRRSSERSRALSYIGSAITDGFGKVLPSFPFSLGLFCLT